MTKKRSGDNYPLDAKGSMVFLGSIVMVPWEELYPGPDGDLTIKQSELRFGVVTKLTQKRGIDVKVFLGVSAENIDEYVTTNIRVQRPTASIVVLDKKELKDRDPLHEAVRMAAFEAGTYD